MPVTDWKFPGTTDGNRSQAAGTGPWADPDNIKVDDSSVATISLTTIGERSDGLAAQNFGFTSSDIPDDAKVTGIEVRLGDWSVDTVSGGPAAESLNIIFPDPDFPNGRSSTEDKNAEVTDPTTTPSTQDIAGEGQLWGDTGTEGVNVQDSQFGFWLAVQLTGASVATEFRVDFMQIRVYWERTIQTTLWQSPGTMVANRTIASSSADWTNADNAKINDTNDASAVLSSATTHTSGLAASNFDFSSITAGAQIVGIEVRITDFVSDEPTSPDWNVCRLIKSDNTDGTEDKSVELDAWSTLRRQSVAGADNDLWSETDLTIAEVQDVDFGFFVGVQIVEVATHTFSIDHMEMRVHFRTGLPTTVHAEAGVSGHSPPYIGSNGSTYIILYKEDGGTSRQIIAMKATDPMNDTWVEQDAAGNPIMAGGLVAQFINTVQNGDIIYIVYAATNAYTHSFFDMSTDEWASFGTQTIVGVSTNLPNILWCWLAARANGDLVAVYHGETDTVMGGEKERVDFKIKTGATWGSEVALDGAGDIHYGNPIGVLSSQGTDDTHVVWQQTTNTADPPTAWEGVEATTIRGADDSVLSPSITGTPDTVGALLGIQNGVVYEDLVENRVEAMWCAANPGLDRVTLILGQESSSTGDIVGGIGQGSIGASGDHPFINGEHGVVTLGLVLNPETGSSDMHALFSGGGTAGVDQDIYHTFSEDEGATWSTATEELDAITCNWLSGDIHRRGSNIVFAYAYDDGGVQKYNEKILFSYSQFLRKKVGVRYY